MRYVKGVERGQMAIRVGCVEDEIGAENPVWFIEAFVDAADVEEMGFERAVPAPVGRKPYDPRDLIKLYVYGYMNAIRSSRKLEREAGRNIELFYLLNRLQPDHNTIADFRKNNRRALKKLFVLFSRACREMKLMDAETLCLDGTTIRATNGKKSATNSELSRKKLEYARAQLEAVERYLTTLDESDLHERRMDKPFVLDLDKDHLPDREELKRRIAYHEECLRELEKSGKNSICFTDPEASMMPAKEGGMKACYNVQTAVDAKSHLISDFEVTSTPSDRGTLNRCMEQFKGELGLETVRVIADKGYESGSDIEACLMNGTVADVGFIYDREERVFSLGYEDAEITEAVRTSSKPEDIQKCLHAGVLPKCMEGSNVRIEVQERGAVSCFIRHEDGTVTCPMGRQLHRLRETTYGTRYGSKDACRTCPNRCTDARGPKRVDIGRNSTYVPVIMYGSPSHPLQQIPNVNQHSPYNHFGRRKQDAKRVMIYIRRDIAKQKLRMQVSEHPFGTLKHTDGAGYFLCRGKEKVTAEFALSSLAYNIRRAITICGGVSKLIERLKGITMPKIQNIR